MNQGKGLNLNKTNTNQSLHSIPSANLNGLTSSLINNALL